MPDTGPTNVHRGPDGTRIGVCLSGGGFRATLYGLGVFRYLAEAGLLPCVEVVAAVSGGSVAAAVLADRWPALAAEDFTVDAFVHLVQEPVHAAVSEHNLRNEALRGWALRRLTLRGRSRGSALGDVLVKRFTAARMVRDLDPALQVILTSTDLSTGRAFRVSRDFIGSYDYGYVEPPTDLSLGDVVAASVAVPGLLPPVYLPTAHLGLRDAPALLSLLDGGVYDNLGLEWFQGWGSGRPDMARSVNFELVVDVSGLLIHEAERFAGIKALKRVRDVQYMQTRASRIRWFVDGLISGERRGSYLISKTDPCSFKLADGSPIDPELYFGALPAGFARALASLRTDLDRFSREEAELLAYHGYWSAHARIGAFQPELAATTPRWQTYADLGSSETVRLLRVLESGVNWKLRR